MVAAENLVVELALRILVHLVTEGKELVVVILLVALELLRVEEESLDVVVELPENLGHCSHVKFLKHLMLNQEKPGALDGCGGNPGVEKDVVEILDYLLAVVFGTCRLWWEDLLWGTCRL